jgi:hypothetical protein
MRRAGWARGPLSRLAALQGAAVAAALLLLSAAFLVGCSLPGGHAPGPAGLGHGSQLSARAEASNLPAEPPTLPERRAAPERAEDDPLPAKPHPCCVSALRSGRVSLQPDAATSTPVHADAPAAHAPWDSGAPARPTPDSSPPRPPSLEGLSISRT